MPQLTVDIGGRPGADCRGYCDYCYFRHAKDVPPFGCRHCPPFRKGCDYCSRSVKERYTGFRDLPTIAEDVLAHLQMMEGELTRVTISGGGDPSCYPRFRELVELIAGMEAPLHIGYTSGKGFDDPSLARFLLDHGLAEISFTIFASSPRLRKRWMHDPTPEVSLRILEELCGGCDVYGAAVVIPGVNDGEVLRETCAWLEERGAKGLILMRFANTRDAGLILDNAPILKGQQTHTVEEFRDLVTDLAREFRMKITGTPLWDPGIGSPFAILSEEGLLDRLPRVTGRATVISGRVAAPFIQQVLDRRGFGCRVIPAEKDIACLITIDDLEGLDPAHLEEVVIFPGRAFVHDEEAREVLSRDGRDREVVRGPETLTADGETSMGMTRNQVLEMELEGLGGLIRLINQYGRKE
ncbi:MAG TPA: methyl coenzyme M reductase-arginine methyltransferase Mmp10 [Methanomicrobiales archaeon]|jgi:methanogenesis marker radical SAM protein|nr:methyl coenzyme M reductase-arginine methyltransferase Mmp10 [Methanomicrobiales archaeon]